MSPRISYVQPSTVTDEKMLAEFDRCAREGTPRPESQAVRAHVPAVFWSFANSWRDVFRNGVADHAIKELCRIYVSRSVLCEFCGNQRSIKAAKAGIVEDDYRDLINFESSTRYSEKQKAALAYAEMITWDLPPTDEVWARLHAHFSEPELVEIGYFIALTMGQQRWLRTLNIEHHQVLAGTDASMAPGTETLDALKATKAQADYWAKKPAQPHAGGGITSHSPHPEARRAQRGPRRARALARACGHPSRRAAAPAPQDEVGVSSNGRHRQIRDRALGRRASSRTVSRSPISRKSPPRSRTGTTGAAPGPTRRPCTRRWGARRWRTGSSSARASISSAPASTTISASSCSCMTCRR